MQWHIKALTQVIAVALLSIGLTGCFDSDNSSSDDASLRVIHAVADAPDVNVSLNGSEQIQGLGFSASTDLLDVDAGDYSVRVDALLPDGGSIDGVINVSSLDVAKGRETSVLAVGDTASFAAGNSDAIRPVVVVTPDEPIDEGVARFNVVHAAQGVPEVDVYVTDKGNGDLSGVTPITLAFGEKASAQLVSDPGRRIRITASGADPTDTTNVLYDSGQAIPALPSGDDYLIAAINNTGAEEAPVRLLAITGDQAEDSVIFKDKDATPALRAAHFSQDAGDVDIAVGGQTVLNAVSFTTVSDFLAVPDSLRNSDDSATVNVGLNVISEDLALADGNFHTGYAVGLDAVGSGDTALDLIGSTDPIRPIATEAQVRVVHAASQVGEVDVYAGTSGNDLSLVLEAVPFKAVSEYLSLPVDLQSGSTDYDFEVYPTGTDPEGNTAAISVSGQTLPAGSISTIIARDENTATPTFSAELVDDADAVDVFRSSR